MSTDTRYGATMALLTVAMVLIPCTFIGLFIAGGAVAATTSIVTLGCVIAALVLEFDFGKDLR